MAFNVLSHHSDEVLEQGSLPFADYVLAIAQGKMDTISFPAVTDIAGNRLFVLTADTLIRTTHTNHMLGKPQDKDDAKTMLRLMRAEPIEVVTGCCLRRYDRAGNDWQLFEQITWTSQAVAHFQVPEEDLEAYFAAMPFVVNCAGAGALEDFGASFLKTINGSYSGTLGLPLYELRQALRELSFRF